MRPPRFRIRTLMIAVAVVAATCWWLVEFGTEFFPLIPICPALIVAHIARLPGRRVWYFVVGGAAGGAMHAACLSVLALLLVVWGGSASDFVVAVILAFAFCVGSGLVCGVLAELACGIASVLSRSLARKV